MNVLLLTWVSFITVSYYAIDEWVEVVIDWLIDLCIGNLIPCILISRLIDWLIVWSIDGLIDLCIEIWILTFFGRLIDWLIMLACLICRYPESRLAKLFNGNIAIVLDSLKQHYFLDRDGRMFRHVLNYVRHGRLMVPRDFQEWALLYEEAVWFAIPGMAGEIEELMDRKPVLLEEESAVPRPAKRRRPSLPANGVPVTETASAAPPADLTTVGNYTFECITVNITPDLGKRSVIFILLIN